MQDRSKTKNQLIDELAAARERIAILEESEAGLKQTAKTCQESAEHHTW